MAVHLPPCYARPMLKLALLLALLIAFAGAAAGVPIHGRTVLDRWQSARGPVDFVERGWTEVKASLAGGVHGQRGARAETARAPLSPTRPGRSPRPVERHSEADRAALDRIVTEHAGR